MLNQIRFIKSTLNYQKFKGDIIMLLTLFLAVVLFFGYYKLQQYLSDDTMTVYKYVAISLVVASFIM